MRKTSKGIKILAVIYVEEHRRQEQVGGKWVTVGMQYYPDCVDRQK